MSWQRDLARPIPYKKPKRGELRTLADARAFAIKRNPSPTARHWQSAMKLMLEASEGGDIEAATKQLEYALLLDGMIYLGEPRRGRTPKAP